MREKHLETVIFRKKKMQAHRMSQAKKESYVLYSCSTGHKKCPFHSLVAHFPNYGNILLSYSTR